MNVVKLLARLEHWNVVNSVNHEYNTRIYVMYLEGCE